MITKVEIENFQSHQHSILHLTDGVNVIIGPSDAGKSAIFRAINWVITNRPLGDAYRSEWGGDTRVALHTQEGDVIERVRSGSTNKYVVNGQTLAAVGSDVPEEVSRVLRMEPANIQGQMDAPFLLASSPGEAARLLNKAASIDDIDRATTNLRRQHSRLQDDINRNSKELEDRQLELTTYEDIPDIETKVTHAEEMDQALTQKITRLSQLGQRVQRIQQVQERLRVTQYVDHALTKSREAEELVQPLTDHSNRLQILKRLTQRIEQTQARVQKAQEEEGHLEQQFHLLAPETCPLCGGKMLGANPAGTG